MISDCLPYIMSSGIPLTGVLPKGVFGIVQMCLALVRQLVFRDR